MSKTVASMNFKFYRLLETPLNVLEMLKLFTWCLLGTIISNFSKERCFFFWGGGGIARFQAKIPIIQIATKFTI